MKVDSDYTSDTVFDTFPWPQSPTKKQIKQVAAKPLHFVALRREIMEQAMVIPCGIFIARSKSQGRIHFVMLTHGLMPAVRAAYGMSADADPLAFLLALNLELAAKEKDGKTITPPGLPLPESERAAFVTTDCITI